MSDSELNNRAQSEMRLKSHLFPWFQWYCEILSDILERGALLRCENIPRPCAPWTTCLQPTRRLTQQQAATLCPKTDAHPIGRLPERSPECQSFNLVPECVSPANSCISRLLRLHIACDLMAGFGQQRCGKEGGENRYVRRSAALKAYLQRAGGAFHGPEARRGVTVM